MTVISVFHVNVAKQGFYASISRLFFPVNIVIRIWFISFAMMVISLFYVREAKRDRLLAQLWVDMGRNCFYCWCFGVESNFNTFHLWKVIDNLHKSCFVFLRCPFIVNHVILIAALSRTILIKWKVIDNLHISCFLFVRCPFIVNLVVLVAALFPVRSWSPCFM